MGSVVAHGVQRDARRLPPQALQQRGQENDLANVCHADGDGALERCGRELCALVQPAVDHAQRIAHGFAQLLGKRRGHHAARGAQEQLVAKNAPQLGQRIADRRLRQPQVVGHFRHAPLDHELLKQHQQVQVDIR